MTYKIAVVAIVEYDGKVLVGKGNAKNSLGLIWHIPGGSLEENETEEQALIREINEEAGIKIKIIKLTDEMNFPNKNIKAKWFLCRPITHDLKAGDDLDEIKYVKKSEVLKICDPRAISLWPKKVLEYFKS